MKICLVYPPNRNIPGSAYGALPLLAGCLGRAGHTVDIVDANLEVFDGFLEPERIERHLAFFDEVWRSLDRPVLTPSELALKQRLAKLAVVPHSVLRGAPEAARALRDKQLFREPKNVNRAYDSLACVLRFYYALNPMYYLLKPGALDEFFAYLQSPIQNPVQELIETVVVPKILATKPDLVGVCIPFNEQMVEAFAVLKAVRQACPTIKTIVGGAIVTSYSKKLCNDVRFYEFADFGLPGEADESFPQFATALEQGTDLARIPNLYRLVDGAVAEPAPRVLPDLNSLPAPDFSRVQLQRYYLPEPIANYQTSRGCYYGKCTFCAYDTKMNFRLRRPELVCEDLEKIYAQTGVKHVIFWDPLTPPKLMRKVSEWNRKRGAEKIYWGAETKFERTFTDREFTALLYEGGGRFLQFGFESGSQRVLDLMVKGNDLSRIDEMLDSLRDAKIAVSVQWFIGFPGETEPEARESFRYLDRRRDAVIMSSYMGTFTLSPDDDIFRSNGDLYDIDLYQRPDGMWDYRYRNPPAERYDTEDLNFAYMARGDCESVTRMAFYIYVTDQPERAREICNMYRVGPLPDTFEELADERPRVPDHNLIRSYDFDIFTPPDEQVRPGGSAVPRRASHGLFNPISQQLHALSDEDLALLRVADGTRTGNEIVAQLGGDPLPHRARLLKCVRMGLLDVPARAPALVATGSGATSRVG
jgi:hypothetical protein